MADDHRNHHHHHRPQRLSLPSRPTTPAAIQTPRSYPLYPYPATTPTPTPSKLRLSSSLNRSSSPSKRNSLSFLFVLLFSLRSFYSLLPFLKSSPSSFSVFPFSFLVCLLSFLLTLSFSLLTSRTSSKQPIFSLALISKSQHRLLVSKSIVLAVVFLLRFQALRYCGTAAMILAELSGNVAARFLAERRNRNRHRDQFGSSKVRGFFVLFIGLFLFSISWDRIECFPFSAITISKFGFSLVPSQNCVRVWPMLLPFLSGFLGCYERVSMNWVSIRELGAKRIRLISLFFTTIVLFIPAVISMFLFEVEGDSISIGSLGWPLANTVLFGVLLSENFSDEKLGQSKDFQKEFLVTFICTILLELFYFPELSLWGLLICGLLIGFAVRVLDPVYSSYVELGLEPSESFTASLMKPIRHILSERKSRKIALFLLINTGYMVVEFAAGFMSNSLGLISDACHMLFDCAALAIGLYASYISRLPANGQFNYGRGRFEVLSGYVNAVFLVLVGALIVLESFERILDPQEISTSSLLTVSVGGLLVNVIGLIFFHEEHQHAHGGGGSCSHGHAHSHEHEHEHHNHHSHDHVNHTHEAHTVHSHCQEDHDHSHHSDNHSEHGHKAHGGVHSHIHDGHGLLDNGNDHHELYDHSHHSHDHDHDHHGHESSDCKGHHNHHNHDHSGKELEIHTVSDGLEQKKLLPYGEEHHHHKNTHIDHNMEGIFLHVLADTMGSVGVVVSTLLIKYKGWVIADPACSIFISVLIVLSVIPLLRNSAAILLQRVPKAHEQDLKKAVKDVMKIKGVRGIQSFHVWSLTNTDVVGTLHLHVSTETEKDSAKARVSQILHNAGINDLTIQVECLRS